MSRSLRAVVFALVLAAPLAAQELPEDLRSAVLSGQPRQFEDPECGLKPGHFRVDGAAVYIQTAMEKPHNRDGLLSSSRKTVIEASLDDGQQDNAGAWYILGRVYLYEVNIVGADSSFTRVEAMAPECAEETRTLRRNAWISIRNYALAQSQRSQLDSAIATYRLGMFIYRGEADVFYVMASMYQQADQPDSLVKYLSETVATEDSSETGIRAKRNSVRRLARIYAEQGEADSAVAYFRIVADQAEAAGDTIAVQSAESQIARVYFNAEMYAEALVAYRVLEARRPESQMIKRNIATVFQAMGQVDSAQAVMASIGAAGAGGGMDTTSARFLINRGVNKFQEAIGDTTPARMQKFEAAAADFTRAMDVEPSNRLALINLGLAYNYMKDGTKLVETAELSIAREPLHELSYQMLVQGYVYLQDPKAQDASNRLDALPITIDSLTVQDSPGLMTITGIAMGRESPSGPIDLVFEFFDADGAVVTSVDVAIPALAPAGTHSFAAQGNMDGLVNWRYRKK